MALTQKNFTDAGCTFLFCQEKDEEPMMQFNIEGVHKGWVFSVVYYPNEDMLTIAIHDHILIGVHSGRIELSKYDHITNHIERRFRGKVRSAAFLKQIIRSVIPPEPNKVYFPYTEKVAAEV